MSRISDLRMSGADDHVVDMFCDHLKDQLTLSLDGGTNAFTVTLTSQASRFVRTIHEFRDNRGSVSGSHRVWDGHEPPPYRLFESQSMVHRVTMLTFAAAMWNDFMGYFPSLPVLVQLSIVSGPYDSDFCMSDLRTNRRLRCPALRTISLHKHLRRAEETSVVSRFIAHGVERKPGPLTVCITSFQLEGPLELFAREIRVLVDGVVVRETEQPPESDSASSV
ncbi:hypothetical protein EXIGLDRAFT_727396 [Exidia glandulosa HHB12029]|uniref:Uncharacterized protein n=1 Tax=Exidia glandulosa HHB12029 TaxID=1314781 RepID=A0A165M2T5_EXIGL|nr:hypothetical protein EXIGLDRAFT_727396 [Exidia glandulosa HHB12029]